MGEFLLPRTDAGVLVQMAVFLIVGIPTFLIVRDRATSDVIWFVGGVLMLMLGLLAVRAVL